MNSVNDIWASVVDILSTQLTSTSINTWFSDCTPLELADGRLVLHTQTKFKRDILVQRFGDQIRTVLSDLFSCNFDLLVLAGDEIEEYSEHKNDSEALPEMATLLITL